MPVNRLLLLSICCLILGFLGGCQSSKKPLEKGAHIRINLACEPPSLDTRKATDTTSVQVLLLLFEGLTRIGPDHIPYPAVAQKILVSEDRLTYTFHLRPASWSDGSRVTAEDFLYAWQTQLSPLFPSPNAYKLYVIENAEAIKTGKLPPERLGVEAIDPATLVVRLAHPTPYFLELLALPYFAPIHKASDQTHPDWSLEAGPHYVSNGPFILKSWEHESELLLSKNPHYWDSSSLRIDTIHMSMIDDMTTEFYMYEMGELDWAGAPFSNISADLLPALQKECRLSTLPTTGVYFFKINTNAFPLQNVHVRRALSLAIDRQGIVEHVIQGGQLPACALIPPMPGWEVPSSLFPDQALKEAREELAKGCQELDLSLEQFPSLILSHNSNREHQKIAQAMQQQWQKELGISVEIETCDWKVYLNKIHSQDYQIGRLGWLGDFNDPYTFLQPFTIKAITASGEEVEKGWDCSLFSHLVAQVEEEGNEEHRSLLIRQAENLFIQEMPIIPLYFLSCSYMKKPYLQGVYISPLGFADFKYAYISNKNIKEL